MNFLRSIKSAKALGLAAAAATMVTASVAPTMAQTPTINNSIIGVPTGVPKNTIKIAPAPKAVPTAQITYFNNSGYNTRFFVTAPKQPTFDTGLRMRLQSGTTKYPVGTEVTIVIRREDNQQGVLQKTFTLNSNICVKAEGTVFNPSGVIEPGTCK